MLGTLPKSTWSVQLQGFIPRAAKLPKLPVTNNALSAIPAALLRPRLLVYFSVKDIVAQQDDLSPFEGDYADTFVAELLSLLVGEGNVPLCCYSVSAATSTNSSDTDVGESEIDLGEAIHHLLKPSPYGLFALNLPADRESAGLDERGVVCPVGQECVQVTLI
jgi:hypothetical protein